MRKIFITGCAGYVGSVLCRRLIQAGYQVVGYDNLSRGHGLFEPISCGMEFVYGDILDRQKMADASRGCDCVIHLAAIVGYPACDRSPELSHLVNVVGTDNVMDLDLPILFASTQSIYGKQEGIVTEETTPNPSSGYAEHKVLGELMVRHTDHVILRFPTLFGLSPNMRWDLLVNDFTLRAATDRVLVVYQPNSSRPILHVEDAITAYETALLEPSMWGQTYNVGSDSFNYTKAEICEVISDYTSVSVIHKEFDRDKDHRDYRIDFRKYMDVTVSDHKVYFCHTIQDGVQELLRAIPLVQR